METGRVPQPFVVSALMLLRDAMICFVCELMCVEGQAGCLLQELREEFIADVKLKDGKRSLSGKKRNPTRFVI